MSSKSIKRRNGQLQACEPCRKAKIRCDHVSPSCGRCVQRDLSCIYHPAPMTRARCSITRFNRLPLSPTTTVSESAQGLVSPGSSRPSVAQPRTLISDGTNTNTLFHKPPTSYGTTRFSAVFSENQASFGPAMSDITEEDGHAKEAATNAGWSKTGDDAVDTAQMELAINTLLNFPTARTCEVILQELSYMDDVWTSSIMIRRCLNQIWSEYGVHLGERRCRASVSRMASDLFENTKHTVHPDEKTNWHNWFGGSRLRWEMLGIVFTIAGFAFKHSQEWDPVFKLPEQQGRNRKTAADKMRECADACVQLYPDIELNDMMVVLIKNIWKLHSIIISDESDRIRTGSGAVVGAFITTGLHRLPTYNEITPLSQYRIGLSASAYFLDKSESLFNGRPPLFSHHYCTYQLPLDLSEDETYSGPEIFAAAKTKLDSKGWNTSGKIHTTTWLRALCLLIPIREEILEMSLGINVHFTKTQVDNLITRLDQIVSSYPPHIQYRNVSQWSHGSSYGVRPARELWLVTRIQLDVLQSYFLLQRLAISRSYANGQTLFDIAHEMMTIVVSLWLNRDQMQNWNFAFDWIVVCYGIPCAGVLCLELLNSTKDTQANTTTTHSSTPSTGKQTQIQTEQKIHFSRSNVIQSLTLFVAFLAWIRPTDGNAQLCWKLRKVVKRIVDSVLDPPVHQNQHHLNNIYNNSGSGNVTSSEEVHTERRMSTADLQGGDADGGGGGGGIGGPGLDRPGFGNGEFFGLEGAGAGAEAVGLLLDDLDWLNTVDWTQGDWLDMNLNLNLNM